jgi:uncharacterized protein YcnI
MRSSGWSSLVISACSAVALVLAAPAAAHLSLTPKVAEVGEDVDLVFSVPNEDDPRGVVRVTVGAPSELELDDGEVKPGWTQSRSGQAITWSGGRIPKGQYATFALRGTAPKQPETVLFNVLVGSESGETTTYRVALDVQKTDTSDTGARTLGKAALFIALGAGVLALAAGFLALYVWLRPPPDARVG